MLVYEFKLKGKPHQYQAIDEAIHIVQFMRNKAVRYWIDHRGLGKNNLYKLAASLPQAFEFADKLNATARQQAKGLGTLKLIGKQCLNQFQDKIKRVRLVRRADGYYAQFCLDIERKEHLASKETKQRLGKKASESTPDSAKTSQSGEGAIPVSRLGGY